MSTLVPWSAADAARHLQVPTASSDKYSRGVVGTRTGSASYRGAAVLGVEGAWRAGAGMVRYVGAAGAEVLARRPETVLGTGRVQAWVVGSGMSLAELDEVEHEAIVNLLRGPDPVVVDAGAIALAVDATAPVVVTPHAGEFARLREQLGLPGVDVSDVASEVVGTAAALGHVVVRKGAQTVIASADGTSIEVCAGTPWLSSAGTGDVLAGIIGAVVAADAVRAAADSAHLAALAATGVWIHGTAARVATGQLDLSRIGADLAASVGPGHPITARDVADAVPAVIGALLRMRMV